MVGALRKAGNGGAADDACSGDANGEAAAVSGVVDVGQALFFLER